MNRLRIALTLVVTSFVVVISMSTTTACNSSGYCKGYHDACMKDCAKAPVAGKTCDVACEEKLATHPGYAQCRDGGK